MNKMLSRTLGTSIKSKLNLISFKEENSINEEKLEYHHNLSDIQNSKDLTASRSQQPLVSHSRRESYRLKYRNSRLLDEKCVKDVKPKEDVTSKKRNIIHRKYGYTLKEKLNIIKHSESGKSNDFIASMFGMHRTTVWLILNRADEYKEYAEVYPLDENIVMHRTKRPLMMKMELLLFRWIDDNIDKVPLDGNLIKEKASTIFESLKQQNGGSSNEKSLFASQEKSFFASCQWLFRFKKRFHLQTHKIKDENNLVQHWLVKLEDDSSNQEADQIDQIDEDEPKIISNEGFPKILEIFEELQSAIKEEDPDTDRNIKVLECLKNEMNYYQKPNDGLLIY